jgi:hypothetical protein
MWYAGKIKKRLSAAPDIQIIRDNCRFFFTHQRVYVPSGATSRIHARTNHFTRRLPEEPLEWFFPLQQNGCFSMT